VRAPCAALRYRLADNVAALRRAHGWTQRQLAAHCPCHKNVISDIERGALNVTLATLEMLACALGCCESDLLFRRPPAAPAHFPDRDAVDP